MMDINKGNGLKIQPKRKISPSDNHKVSKKTFNPPFKYNIDPNSLSNGQSLETKNDLTQENINIHQAAKEGSIERIKKAVQQHGMNVDSTDKFKQTALHKAVNAGHYEVVKALIDDLKATPNVQDENGWTPLYIACRKENFELVKLLLDKGANPNLSSFETINTPLSIVCEKANLPLAKLLLEYKAAVNIESPWGNELHAIAKCNYKSPNKLPLMKLLLEYGSNLNQKDSEGLTPKDYCQHGEFNEILGHINE